MAKKYKITRKQFESLCESETTSLIRREIFNAKDLNESKSVISEAVVDTIKKFLKKGLLTTAVIASLLSANDVNANDLRSAGVPQDKIEQAMEQGGGKAEKELLQALKRGGQVGTISKYNNLNPAEKEKVLSQVQKVLDKGENLKDYTIQISKFINSKITSDNSTEIAQDVTITVDTVKVAVIKEYATNFINNSVEIKDVQQTKDSIQTLLNSFHTIDKVVIFASSSALRNTGDVEGMTWVEVSQARGNALKEIMNGMDYDLGGCDKNETKQITEDMISINSSGKNGDGTSGPKSPYEVSQKSIQYYQEQNIPEELWKSEAEGEPYDSLDEYKKHQYVKVVVYGDVVETETNEIINYKYLTMKKDAKVQKVNKPSSVGRVDVTKCPIKM